MSTALSQAFSVVLREDLTPNEYALLSQFGSKLVGPGDRPLINLPCTTVSFAEGFFLQMNVLLDDGVTTHALSVPRHLVLVVSGASGRSPIGFLSTIP